MNPHQSLAGPSSTPQGSARSTALGLGDDISGGNRACVSQSNPSVRARQAGDLFRPVTSSEPPVTAIPVQPVEPVNGLEQDGELVSVPALQSGSASDAPKGVSRGDGLVFGARGAVIALVASAALVLALVGVSMLPTSSSGPSSVAVPEPGRLQAPKTPMISDASPATVPAADAPGEPAGLPPAETSSLPQPALSPRQQPAPAAHRPASAPPAQTPPAPDHGPVPPSSTVTTTDDTESPTVITGSDTENRESQTTNTEPCNCDDTMHKVPTHWGPPPTTDRPQNPRAPRDSRAQGNGSRETNTPRDYEASNKERPGRTARPDPPSKPSPGAGYREGHQERRQIGSQAPERNRGQTSEAAA